MQLLTVVAMLIALLVFDLAFTSESMFIFDPDADNWRRKVVSHHQVVPSLSFVFEMRSSLLVFLPCLLQAAMQT